MGAAESNPVRNLDKRTARRTYRDDFRGAIKRYRTSTKVAQQWAFLASEDDRSWEAGDLKVCVRKRPIFKSELQGKEFDVLTVTHGKLITVHDARMHADMRRQLMNHHEFIFDRVFNENADNDQVYAGTAAALVQEALKGGFATCLMYGQTGSGKTYTMTSIYERAVHALYDSLAEDQTVSLSFVEIAGEKCNDLLNCFKPTQLLTGKDESVHAFPVVEPVIASAEDLLAMINHGCSIRATEATGVHDASSRSHAILRIYIHNKPEGDGVGRRNIEREGVLTLVDLAGSEHRIDSMYHTAKLRKEGGQINASLMALKQCVHAKAAGKNASHVYRKSKLTMALKMSFMLPSAKTVVIATVSPSSKDTEHSLNTLRHACVMDGQAKKRLHTTGDSDDKQVLSSHIGGGNVRTVRVGTVQVSREARKLKVMSEREKNKLVSNGNTFGYGAAHTEWAKPPTEREIEKQHRAAERSAFKKLTKQQKDLLKVFRAKLGRDPRQERRLQVVPVAKDPWWAKNENCEASIDQQWAKADIDQLIENDPHREGRTSFKQNHSSTLSACAPSSRNNKQMEKKRSKFPKAPPHVYRKLKSIIFNDASLHINVKKRQLRKLLKKKGYSPNVPELMDAELSPLDEQSCGAEGYVEPNRGRLDNCHRLSHQEPSQSLQIQNMSLPDSENNYNINDTFIPSESFNGLKNGYAYKNGHLGVGYYLEVADTVDNNCRGDDQSAALPYNGDINEAMRHQDRDAIRKIMATRSDYRNDSRNSNAENAQRKAGKENGVYDCANNEKQSLFRKPQQKTLKSRHQMARERRQKQIEKEQAMRRDQVLRKQKSRANESGSLHDEIDALEREIANASTSASKVGLKKRLAQKKAILIRQERKAGQARREAERAAEADRIRKKKIQDLQMLDEDAHNMHDVRHQQHSPLSQAISDFHAKGNSNGYTNHPIAPNNQDFYPPQQRQQHFQPPTYHEQPTHSRQQYHQQHNYDQHTNGASPGNYDEPFRYGQQPNPVYGHGHGPNKPREVDADNWSPGDWRNKSMSRTNQMQGGVGSAPFANDYTWNKERY